MMRLPIRLHVTAYPPRDNFKDCTMSISDWMRRDDETASARYVKLWQYAAARRAVARHAYWTPDGFRDPRVVYDVRRDNTYFLFKQGDNGTTFAVTDEEAEDVGAVDDWCGDRIAVTLTESPLEDAAILSLRSLLQGE